MSEIADQLVELNAAGILVLAAERGYIKELRCAMPVCFLAEGGFDNRAYFEKRGAYLKWQPSADRWPVPAREGGQYTVENVRLSHFECNRREGNQWGGRKSAANLTPGERSERSRKGSVNLTPAQRSERATRAALAKTGRRSLDG